MSAFGIRNQCLFLVIYSAVILLIAFAMSGSESNTTVTRYVCCSCEARKRPSFFNSRKGAHQHITKSSRCYGSKVKSVKNMIRPGDVIAGGGTVELVVWGSVRCRNINRPVTEVYTTYACIIN
jgi:hypothetical protein